MLFHARVIVYRRNGMLPWTLILMERSFMRVCFVAAAAAGVILPALADAQDVSPLAGVWTLNRSLSESPREIGFNINWIPSSNGAGQNTGSSAGSSGGGRGRRGSGGGGGGNRGAAGPVSTPRES